MWQVLRAHGSYPTLESIFNSLAVRQASAPEGVSPAQRWILVDPGDEYILKRKRKLEVSDANASERLKATKLQPSSGDPEIIIIDDDGVRSSMDLEIARDDVDQCQHISENIQDIVSITSSGNVTDFREVSRPSQRSK